MSKKPTAELEHFTGRVKEQDKFREVLNIAAPDLLPTLNFYGVGGIGKTWLRRRFEQIRRDEFPNVVSAFIDFDTRTKQGGRYTTNPAEAWSEIVQKLKIPCPRFLLAYAVMLSKQFGASLAGHHLTEGESSKLELLKDLAEESGIPFLGIIARKTTELMGEARLQANPDFKTLNAMDAEQIYDELVERLAKDLNEYQPRERIGQCHSVIFLDTFEVLGDISDKINQEQREKWVQQLARKTKRTLIVTLGRNRLLWDERQSETYWNQTQHLEQHLLGSLSEADARLYLERCEINDVALQNEVLRDSYCPPDPNTPVPSDIGYHPWTLGLCADTLWTMREDSVSGTFPPAHQFRFEAGEHGPSAVVNRFLEAQGDKRRRWIERLAVTLRFDRAAAVHSYRVGEDEREVAWERLRECSFLSPATSNGWYVLHSHMRNQILEILSAERKSEEHFAWHSYWQSRI